ncbi:A/G-specific adenine glycosylase [Tenacibaculum sp. 190524A02b]|uniref:A/G-specific adenine glycosylase n=1 Tax=Tenacibaculum vairaonense TaxID=3137860 RepID=UPI0031FA4954
MIFYKELAIWYENNKRNLPWRETQNPYFIWLSEIMLQQTRVSQGLPYFLKFTEVFPTVFDLAKAKEEKVLKLWQGLGYYSRARNLHLAAKYVVDELNGIFPDNYKNLLDLKGVGDYTASAIASICFNEPVAVVDGNVYRVLSRFFGVSTPINTTKGIKEFKKLAQSLIDIDNPGDYNQAIMDFGALHCKPQNPLCSECSLANSCVAYQNKQVNVLPVKVKKIKIKKRFFNYLVLETFDGKTILEERIGKGIWQGLYQFPLLESEKRIEVEELIESKIFNELFTGELTVKLFNSKEIVHKLSHQHLHVHFWIIKSKSKIKVNVDWDKVREFPVPVLIENFLKAYLNNKS